MEYFANELYAPLVFGVSTGGAGLKSKTNEGAPDLALSSLRNRGLPKPENAVVNHKHNPIRVEHELRSENGQVAQI